jgi:UDP:flavonoid glycosyltransferase YjiC (YdhE family)
VRFVGPLLSAAPSSFREPAWWPELRSGRPVVHVTQGTVDNHDLGKLLEPTLRGLADEDVLVVATTGGRPVSELGFPVPANARVEAFVPHDRLLPHVDVMVTNAGYGGVQRALADGVPLVVAGDTEDKPEVAARVAWAGVGVNLRSGRPSAGAVRSAVRSVLDAPGFAARARALQAEFAMYDGPLEAARLVEELLGAPAGGRGRARVAARCAAGHGGAGRGPVGARPAPPSRRAPGGPAGASRPVFPVRVSWLLDCHTAR